MRPASFVIAIVVSLVPATSPAQVVGMPAEPGLWEFSSSIPDPIYGQPLVQRYRTCVRETFVTPQRVMQVIEECRIRDVVVRGSSARWKMRCQTPAGLMDGGGSLRSNGSSVAGTLDLAISVGSFEIPVTGTFKGKRIGKCR